MAYLGETCSSSWMLNQNAFVQDPVPPVDGYRKEEINISYP